MSRQLKFLIIVTVLILAFLYAVSGILLPFVLGMTFAYLLDPLADRLENRGLSRQVSTVIIMLIFFTVASILCMTLIPVIFDQLTDLAKNLPKFYRQFDHKIVPMVTKSLNKISPALSSRLHIESKDITSEVADMIGVSVGGIFSSSVSLLNFLSLILITPIITFYMLRDWDLFMRKFDSLLPRDYAPTIRQQLKKIDDTIGAFIHGQLNACFIMGLVYGLTLTLVGLNFGFIIGLFTGLLIFIPFIGTIIGASIGVAVAYFQYPQEPNQVLFIFFVFLTIHLVESNLISPKIIGGKIGIHPAWLLFGMLAGGSLLGFVGVLLSVPLTAVIGVLVRFALEQYSDSDFYAPHKKKKKIKIEE